MFGEVAIVESLPGIADDVAEGGDARPSAVETEMSDLQKQVLELESQEWPTPGHKARSIRQHLRMSPTRYYQVLNLLLDDPRAAETSPLVVLRLRRERHRRVERWRTVPE